MKKFVIFILCFICMCGLSGCKGSVADSGLNIDGSETLVDVYIEKIIVKESDSTLNIANTYFFRNELYKYRLIEIDSSNVEVCFSDGTVKLLEDAFKTGEVSLEDLKANNIQYAKDYLFSIQDQVKYDYDMFGKEIEVEKKNEVFYEDDEYSYFFDTAKSQYMILKYKNGRTENAVEALQCGKITLEDFNRFDIGYYILAKNIVPGTEKTVANIVNEATWETCATEVFYQDDEYVYYFHSGYAYGVYVYYIDGTRENICPALESGRAKVTDLDKYGISYNKYEVGGKMNP